MAKYHFHFYENRSTPVVTDFGAKAPKSDRYGKKTKTRASKPHEEEWIDRKMKQHGGKKSKAWIRVDEHGNGPSHPKYKGKVGKRLGPPKKK